MWYNSSTKLLKRYTVNNSVYAWETIEGSESQLMLTQQQVTLKILPTRKGVSLLHNLSPKTKYDIGDLWANATFGTTYNNDLLRCKRKT